MYLSRLTIENFRCFGQGDDARLDLKLHKGLTALVGENDSGKTAVIDAIRLALGTTDQDWPRVEDADFNVDGIPREIRIACTFDGLTPADLKTFLEYLTYPEQNPNSPVLHVNWTARDTGETRHGRPYRVVSVRSGRDGNGPTMAPEARDMLRATYLRPLRDAEQALSAGRGSRFAQVLRHSKEVKDSGNSYQEDKLLHEQKLSVAAIATLLDQLLQVQQGIENARGTIDKHLSKLALSNEQLRSEIRVAAAELGEDARVRNLLEKLDLVLSDTRKPGLGTNNLLFMACELVLLVQEAAGNRMLLIEEPEAHLHAQRQLQVMQYMQEQAADNNIQVIITTHSPNLASVIQLNNLVMIHRSKAYPMSEGQTKLKKTDYRFLERFLDITKANLFFARGVIIVEGDAEAILLPTIAKIIGRDFTKHGVSIVNVGSTGLRRYARIFQRVRESSDSTLDIPVACITDMDVMPDCAPAILGKDPNLASRKWKKKSDFASTIELKEHRSALEAKASGQQVRTFVADEWTLEYDLALGPKSKTGEFPGGLAEDLFVAIQYAKNDDGINEERTKPSEVREMALNKYKSLLSEAMASDGCKAQEALATKIYAILLLGGISKSITAQYLAEVLLRKEKDGTLSADELRLRLPEYLCKAIDYVTGSESEDFNEPENLNGETTHAD